MGLTPILERYYVLSSRLFDNIVSDPNEKLEALIPPYHVNSRYNLRRERRLTFQSFVRTEQVIRLNCDVETVRAVVLSHSYEYAT